MLCGQYCGVCLVNVTCQLLASYAGCLPCIIPASELWSVKRKRMLVGREHLAGQHVFVCPDKMKKLADVLGKSTSELEKDLAGNAFNGSATVLHVITMRLHQFIGCNHIYRVCPHTLAVITPLRQQLRRLPQCSSRRCWPSCRHTCCVMPQFGWLFTGSFHCTFIVSVNQFWCFVLVSYV